MKEWNEKDVRGYYILDGHTPVPEPDLMKWAAWYGGSYRDGTHWVAQTDCKDGSIVSTIFLGLDHGFGDILGDSTVLPILFETMSYTIKENEERDWGDQERCSTWDEAVEMHKRVVDAHGGPK